MAYPDHPPAESFFPEKPTLPALRQALEGCRACPLYRDAEQAVFGAGPKAARLMLVGEMPGDQEDRAGRPFLGSSGQLLDELLVEAGIDRGMVYVTNAVKHFKFEPRGKKRIHQTPNLTEVRACVPWLEEEVELVAPELVVCLGSTAANAVIGPDVRIRRDHGQRFEARLPATTTATETAPRRSPPTTPPPPCALRSTCGTTSGRGSSTTSRRRRRGSREADGAGWGTILPMPGRHPPTAARRPALIRSAAAVDAEASLPVRRRTPTQPCSAGRSGTSAAPGRLPTGGAELPACRRGPPRHPRHPLPTLKPWSESVDEKHMRRALALAVDNVESGRGGPFGAVVVRAGEVIAEGTNVVTTSNDPTAHAEVRAIRAACERLGTFQLSGCEIYTSCEPCPMCLGAVYWARLDRVWYAARRDQAAAAGFSDELIYQEIPLAPEERTVPARPLLAAEGDGPFTAWRAKPDKVPY